MSTKESWPELEGKDADHAKAVIEREGGCTVHFIEPGAMVTMDYRTERVRITRDGDGKVVGVPRRG